MVTLLVVATTLLALGSQTPGAAGSATLTVRVPYMGSQSAAIPTDWILVACPQGQAPDMVSVTCSEPGKVTFTATDYAPGAQAQNVTIAVKTPRGPQTLTYSVVLSPPQLSGPQGGTLPVPVTEGIAVTIPYSNLGYVCEQCTQKAPTFVADAVAPPKAGLVRFSGVGLVFYPAPDFVGKAELRFHVRDGFGQKSAITSLSVNVIKAIGEGRPVESVTVGGDAFGQATGNLLRDAFPENSTKAADSAKAVVSSCDQPTNGWVTCSKDGFFLYRARPGFTGIDQFAFTVLFPEGGYQVLGSVTVGVQGDPAGVLAGKPERERTPLLAPGPTGKAGSGYTGVFPLLKDAVSRVDGGWLR